jgi:hypothetical protein
MTGRNRPINSINIVACTRLFAEQFCIELHAPHRF